MNLLILSIGSNPMPNFIVADYLLNDQRTDKDKLPIPDKILFVYSASTKDFKNSIVKLVQKKYPDTKEINIDLGTGERDFDYIKTEVKKKLEENKEISSVHLNYTGGTKPMAVAICSAIEAVDDEQKLNTTSKILFSDLSPTDFCLTLRDGRVFPLKCTEKKLTDYVKISIEELYDLHGLKVTNVKREHSSYYTTEFVDFLIKENQQYDCQKLNFLDKWDAWPKRKKLKELKNDIEGKIKDYSKKIVSLSDEQSDFTAKHKLLVEEYIKNLNDKEKLKCIQCNLIAPLKMFIEQEQDQNHIKSGLGNRTLKGWKKFGHFICSDWLEEYVFQVLKSMDDSLGLNDVAWNIIQKTDKREFEIDVIAMRGCQTFVLSCTTDSDMGTCKLKAFEAIYRAEQLGGEHSKTILVCLAKDKILENIKKDMSQFDAANNFSILGIDDIKDPEKFKSALKTIIEGE